MNVLPIGGNHITKDISKGLKIELEKAEDIKINFDKKENFLNNKDFSLEFLQKIIFARTEEIFKMCARSIKLSSITTNCSKVVLMGEGSKILNDKYKKKFSIDYDLDFLEETAQDFSSSGFMLGVGLNVHEVTVLPKKPIKQGFFERFFHFFN